MRKQKNAIRRKSGIQHDCPIRIVFDLAVDLRLRHGGSQTFRAKHLAVDHDGSIGRKRFFAPLAHDQFAVDD